LQVVTGKDPFDLAVCFLLFYSNSPDENKDILFRQVCKPALAAFAYFVDRLLFGQQNLQKIRPGSKSRSLQTGLELPGF
jgi:hypothetical protein